MFACVCLRACICVRACVFVCVCVCVYMCIRTVGADPEYLLCKGEGFKFHVARKKVWEIESLTDAHFMMQSRNLNTPAHAALKAAGIDSQLHDLLISAGLELESLKMVADDKSYLDSLLKDAGIVLPGDRVRIVNAVRLQAVS